MSLFSVLNVSASGMAAQRMRTEVLVENLANSDTTRTPEGGPYRRKDIVLESQNVGESFGTVFETQMSGELTGVRVAEVRVDSEEPLKRYIPGHPDADADGYVAMPRVNTSEDMVDLMGAARGYGANVAAVSAVKDMIQRSIDLFR